MKALTAIFGEFTSAVSAMVASSRASIAPGFGEVIPLPKIIDAFDLGGAPTENSPCAVLNLDSLLFRSTRAPCWAYAYKRLGANVERRKGQFLEGPA